MGFLQKKLKGIETEKIKKKKIRIIQFLRRFFKSRDRNVEEGRRDKFCFVSSVLQKMCPYWLWLVWAPSASPLQQSLFGLPADTGDWSGWTTATAADDDDGGCCHHHQPHPLLL